MPRSLYQRIEQQSDDSLSKLLGPLEIEIMELLWARGSSTVRDVANELQARRALAYTTVMTVMVNLAEKGLLSRIALDKRTHLYEVAMSRQEFVEQSNERVVHALVSDFGDLALTEFAVALENATPEQRARIRLRIKERAARARRERSEGDAG